jgi:single-strand DNA-binding protein
MILTICIGHLGKDAIVNQVNGKNVINFSVAHTKSYKNAQGQKIESTLWVDCAWWLDNTTVAQYLKKGTQVYVQGEPSVETYQTQDRQTRATFRIRVEQMQLLGSKQQNGQPAVPPPPPTDAGSASNDPADDLPF